MLESPVGNEGYYQSKMLHTLTPFKCTRELGIAIMEIDFYYQSSKITFKEMLETSFRKSKRISIATAYISREGLENIKSYIEDSHSIRIVCSIHGNVSDLNALNDFSRDFNQVEGHVFSERKLFHSKLYIFQDDGKRIAWIGSANLTRGGMINNEETLICLKGNSFDTPITSMIKYFDNLWETRSVPVEYYLSKHPDYAVKKLSHELTKVQSEIVESYELKDNILTFEKKYVGQEIYNNGKVTIPTEFNKTFDSLKYCSSSNSRIIDLVLPNGYKIKARFYHSKNNTTRYYQFYIRTQRDKEKWKEHIEMKSNLEFEFNLNNHTVKVQQV